MTQEQYKLLMSKIRQPIHISYISGYILKLSEQETQIILDKLIEEGKAKESELAKGYYVAIQK